MKTFLAMSLALLASAGSLAAATPATMVVVEVHGLGLRPGQTCRTANKSC